MTGIWEGLIIDTEKTSLILQYFLNPLYWRFHFLRSRFPRVNRGPDFKRKMAEMNQFTNFTLKSAYIV